MTRSRQLGVDPGDAPRGHDAQEVIRQAVDELGRRAGQPLVGVAPGGGRKLPLGDRAAGESTSATGRI
jgi:hypothetical protein